MTISTVNLREYVIEPTLSYLGTGSVSAVKLLMGTAAQESDFDPFTQRNQGLGIYQITPEQHHQTWDHYLAFRPELASLVRGLASQHQFLKNPDKELVTNLAYSTAIAWIIYLQSESQLPAADDYDALGYFWQHHFAHEKSAQPTAHNFAH